MLPSTERTSTAARPLAIAAVSAVTASIVLFVINGLLGPSLAQPDLPGFGPARHFAVSPNAWVVTTLLWAAVVLGGVGVACGWAALVRGWQPPVRPVQRAGALGAVAMAMVPPLGSSDITSYAIYGRLAALGNNPYAGTANDLLAVGDPVAMAYEGAWPTSSSVYGPVATASQYLASLLSGDSLRMFALWTQLLELGVFLALAWLLIRIVGGDLARRQRVAVLWTANPLMMYLVVNSAHVDGLAVLFGVAALLVVRRTPVGAGVLVALAVGTKVSLVLYVLALAWALRNRPRDLAVFLFSGALTGLVLIVPFLPELLDPLSTASQYVARQSPWRVLIAPFEAVFPDEWFVPFASAGVWVLVALVVWRLAKVLPRPPRMSTDATQAAAWGAAALSVAWVLSSTYALAWYDTMAWAPLVVLPASRIDMILLARTTLVAAVYAPGLDIDPPGALGSITTFLSGTLAPVVDLCLLLLVLFGGRRLLLPHREEPQSSASLPAQ